MERSKFESMLTEEQIAEMVFPLTELIQSQGFEVFKELLQGSRILAREQALDGDEGDIKFWKGYIEGLKAAEILPASVLARAEEVARGEDIRSKKKAQTVGSYGSTTF